jgi:23S rRNA pseudouridine1911/1915/1917 synthase
MAVVQPERGKSAVTHYQVIARFATTSLVRARIETGRTHQIRVHLGHMGLPVVGDPVYGRTALDRLLPDCPARQMLHAERLAFAHPVSGQALDFKRPPPADMRRLVTRLRREAK